jgi:single-stranded-DNA-specific exonuclease
MRWIFREVDSAAVVRLALELNIPTVLARILVLRGYDTAEAAHGFLNPCLNQLHSPFLMADMEHAVQRLRRAIDQQEKILIYGDYDVDGTMSVVVLSTALRALGARFDSHIPHRLTDGYGMRVPVIERAAVDGFKVVLSVDTGIRDHEVIGRAQELGLDCIVTDHHLPGETLPAAFAILNPKRSDCRYPEKNLCGVGVAFKLAQALLGARMTPRQVESYLKIVSLGTIADIVPLVGENRVIAHLGLAGLRTPVHQGLEALLQVSGLRGGVITAGDVGYRVAPRLNAAGRMESAHDVIDLFTGTDRERGREIADRLDRLNQERQQVEEQMVSEIEETIAHGPGIASRYFLVFAKEGWHRGVVGIAAQRIAERYYRPTLVISLETQTSVDGGLERVGHGSGRSIPGFHLLNALSAVKHRFIRFGGHAQAAGFTVDSANIADLEAELETYAHSMISVQELEPALRVDAEITLDQVNWEFCQALKRLEPFGFGNPTPVFGTRGLTVAAEPRVLKEKHLKVRVAQTGKSCEALVWGGARDHFALAAGQQIDAAYSVQENNFEGLVGIELNTRDLKLLEQ